MPSGLFNTVFTKEVFVFVCKKYIILSKTFVGWKSKGMILEE